MANESTNLSLMDSFKLLTSNISEEFEKLYQQTPRAKEISKLLYSPRPQSIYRAPPGGINQSNYGAPPVGMNQSIIAGSQACNASAFSLNMSISEQCQRARKSALLRKKETPQKNASEPMKMFTVPKITDVINARCVIRHKAIIPNHLKSRKEKIYDVDGDELNLSDFDHVDDNDDNDDDHDNGDDDVMTLSDHSDLDNTLEHNSGDTVAEAGGNKKTINRDQNNRILDMKHNNRIPDMNHDNIIPDVHHNKINSDMDGNNENPDVDSDNKISEDSSNAEEDVNTKSSPIRHVVIRRQRRGSKPEVPRKIQTKPKEYALHHWSIIPKDNSYDVYVKGLSKENSVPEWWASTEIKLRINNRKIVTNTGSVYHLMGAIDQTSCLQSGLTESFVKAFSRGFPINWQDLVRYHFESKKSIAKTNKKSTKGKPTSTAYSQKKSNRRKLVPNISDSAKTTDEDLTVGYSRIKSNHRRRTTQMSDTSVTNNNQPIIEPSQVKPKRRKSKGPSYPLKSTAAKSNTETDDTTDDQPTTKHPLRESKQTKIPKTQKAATKTSNSSSKMSSQNYSGHTPSNIMNKTVEVSVDEGRRTRSGRTVIPRLDFWLGQRIKIQPRNDLSCTEIITPSSAFEYITPNTSLNSNFLKVKTDITAQEDVIASFRNSPRKSNATRTDAKSNITSKDAKATVLPKDIFTEESDSGPKVKRKRRTRNITFKICDSETDTQTDNITAEDQVRTSRTNTAKMDNTKTLSVCLRKNILDVHLRTDMKTPGKPKASKQESIKKEVEIPTRHSERTIAATVPKKLAAVGTLKRKRQLREMLEKQDADYEGDDWFDSTPFRNMKIPKYINTSFSDIDVDPDISFSPNNMYQNLGRPSWMPNTPAPPTPALLCSPAMLEPITSKQRRDAELYVHRIQKQKQKQRHQELKKPNKTVPKKAADYEEVDVNPSKLHDLLKYKGQGHDDTDDDDDEKDYYWSDSTME